MAIPEHHDASGIYTKLDSSTDSIRILVLEPRSHSNRIICSLEVVGLDSPPQFEALSYVWGDESKRKNILVNGTTISVTENLEAALRHLRTDSEPRRLWVDAVCICQKNNDEKSSQVRQMGKVYSSAEQVLLWLGESTSETIDAFQYMRSKQNISWPGDWDRETDFSGLKSLLSLLERPWFQRVWVIQEITLNEKVLMACGSDCINFNAFEPCVSALWKFFKDWGNYPFQNPAVLGFWCATRLIDIRKKFQSGPVCYETLLETASHCRATNVSDMVFAFRAIADDRPVPEPDYTKPVEEVYTETAIALLCNGESLDFLALGGIARQETSKLPTWIPDHRHHSVSEPISMCDAGRWNAGGSRQAEPVPREDRLQLRIKVFDTVEVTCSEIDSYSVYGQKNALQEILGLRRRLPCEVSEKAWMDVVYRSLIFGLDVDDEPAQPEFRKHFDEWLQCLQSSSAPGALEKISSNKYYLAVQPRVDEWKAFVTRQGYFCIGPPVIAAGDWICAVPGCRLPLIVRPDSDAEPLPECILVGWCYADGLMHGEAMALEQLVVDILLR